MDSATDAARLRAEVAQHNAAIRRHRKERHQAVMQLAAIQEAARKLGIQIERKPQHSEGAVHGRTGT